MTREQNPSVGNRLWALFCMVFDHRADTTHGAALRSHLKCARCGAVMKATGSR